MKDFCFLREIRDRIGEDPGRTAFHIAGTDHSYGELGALISGISAFPELLNESISHFGVVLNDDLHTYASILALWFSGKAFVPVNPLFPESRNWDIIGQTALSAVFCSGEDFDQELPEGCSLRSTGGVLAEKPAVPVLHDFSFHRDAYVLFTSGSTGRPKGVRISFGNLNAFVRDFIAFPSFDFGPDDRFLQIYDLSFDASVHCYTVPLALGASAYTVPPDGIKYLEAYRLMHEHELTFVKMPPSTLTYLKPHFPSIQLPKLKYCLLGGEAFPVQMVGEFEKCIPNALIQNVYGPTEATINCLIYDWNSPGGSRKEFKGIASVGRPFGSNSILVVDEQGRESDPGESGELLVSGEQVSPGYWRNPEQDELAFLESGGKRYYRTGDMVTMDKQGDVLFLGRNDEQVQIRGYRVELEEIEALAREYLGGINVLAAGIRDEAGDMKIQMALETEVADEAGLRKHLLSKLPPYMLPSEIWVLPVFPRLVSGKLDRRAIINHLSNE